MSNPTDILDGGQWNLQNRSGEEQAFTVEILDPNSEDFLWGAQELDEFEATEHTKMPADKQHFFVPHDQKWFEDQANAGSKIIVVRGADGKIAAKTNLILNVDDIATQGIAPDSKALEGLELKEIAFASGSLVSQEYQGFGLQKELTVLREQLALEAGAKTILSVIDPENIPSNKAIMGSDFKMVAAEPETRCNDDGTIDKNFIYRKDIGEHAQLKDLRGVPLQDNECFLPFNKVAIQNVQDAFKAYVTAAGYLGWDCIGTRIVEFDGQEGIAFTPKDEFLLEAA